MTKLSIELAKELIAERLAERGNKNYGWINADRAGGFATNMATIGVLPHPCSYHHKPVYNNGIECNSVRINHYKQEDCLFLNPSTICCNASLVTEGEHKGKVFVSFARVNFVNGEVQETDYGYDYDIDSLSKIAPDFVRELVFNLKGF